MAQDPAKPRNNGRVRLPKVDTAMNRLGPTAPKGGKGAKGEAVEQDYPDKAGKDDKAPLTLQPGSDADDKSTKRDDKENAALLERARKRFKRACDVEADGRKATLDDIKHKTGQGQWPADVIAARNVDNRPCLTVNKLPVFVRQVVNEVRQNRPQPKVSPVGDKSDKEVAKFYRGLIRSIERNSHAEIAYNTMFEHAVDGGFGYLRVMTEYLPKSFKQEIIIRRVRNRFTVYLDPARQEPDGSDAKWGFITELVPRSEFESDFPDADNCAWQEGGVGENLKDWITEHEIRIAEYYEIENEPRALVHLANGHVGWKDELDDEAKKLEVLEEREADDPKVKWYKLTANEVLDERDWPGQWVPIVECIGNEDDVEGKVVKSGVIRAAKVPQQMYNFHRTLGVEIISLQPKAPYIVEVGQIEGYEDIWQTANTKNHPYLPYKSTNEAGEKAPPPRREQFTGAPLGVIAEVKQAAEDFQAVTGLRFDATMGERVYDESGRALRELQKKGDTGSFHYVDNLAVSMRHLGNILVDLIPKVYDTPQMLTILREDTDAEEQVMIDPDQPQAMKKVRQGQGRGSKVLRIYNPNIGRYGVTITVGPSAATRRIEAFESMIAFIKVLPPQVAQMVADLVAKNGDWEGADELASRLAKLLPPHLVQDSQLEDLPPQAQAMIMQMRQQLQQLTGERAQLLRALTDSQADRAQRQSKIDKDFEVKLFAILQRADAAYQQAVGSQLSDLAEGIKMLEAALQQPVREPGAAAQPGMVAPNAGASGAGGRMPDGARQARDGNHYLPDPQRPGKFLMVAQ